MIFDQLFQFFAYHAAALGAFCVTLLVVAFLCLCFYKLGYHDSGKRWKFQVEHMPQVIGQDIRERLERRIVALAARNKYLEERNDQMTPAFKSLSVIAEHFVRQDREREE